MTKLCRAAWQALYRQHSEQRKWELCVCEMEMKNKKLKKSRNQRELAGFGRWNKLASVKKKKWVVLIFGFKVDDDSLHLQAVQYT